MTLSDFFRGDFNKELEQNIVFNSDVISNSVTLFMNSSDFVEMPTLAPSNLTVTRALNFDAPSQSYVSNVSELRSRIDDLENRLIAIEITINSTTDTRAALTERIRQIEDRLYDMERQQ